MTTVYQPLTLFPKAEQAIHREPNWLPVSRCTSGALDYQTRRWLLDEGSLTKRLVAASQHFHVRVLGQYFARPHQNETRLLHLPQRQHCLIREVILHCDQRPVVFARSLMPLDTLNGPFRYLRKLGSLPLGALLFADPGLKREEFEIAYAGAASFDVPSLLGPQPEALWGRRSKFRLRGKQLLVGEIFLPTARDYLC
jgi:chorismate--pyruvate lyase